MTETKKPTDLLSRLNNLNAQELRRLLVEHLTKRKLGLAWERNAIEHDEALNADIVLPRLVPEWSYKPADVDGKFVHRNLIIEGDNFDALRLLKATHSGRIRVIYIDPPYNTGNKDWIYNDSYVGDKDRWRHSMWLEFMYQRLVLARDLLSPDGVILVSINDENRAKLEMLMDEALPGMRLGTITWRTRQGSNADQDCFLSADHEHILVYGNEGFKFNGFNKTYEMYGNDDDDPRGDWRSSDLTLGFSYKERPNLYYPLLDPATGISYPANPDRIWVYASESRLKPGQVVQTKTMEEFIYLGQILFPKGQRTVVWNTMGELLAAIDSGDVPKTNKALLLRRDLPNLEYWVGRPVGFGRPQFKRYKADLRNQTQPLSSWIVPSFETGNYEAEDSLVSGTNQEGARDVASIFGDRAFNYAKPLSLIKGLLLQASRPGDVVLDFFAGSGTTGQAVLELNAEDGGARRFILCSSTEATGKEPNKNICRDITSQRLRRVIARDGYTGDQGGEFAYLQLDKVAYPDVRFETRAEHAIALLSLRLAHAVRDTDSGQVQHIARADNCDILVCMEVSDQAFEELVFWPAAHGVQRLAVYCERPLALQEALESRGVEVNCHSLIDAMLNGQAGARV